MGIFKFTKKEQELNKALKYNQDISAELLNDTQRSVARAAADNNITSSGKLLKSLGYEAEVSIARKTTEATAANRRLEHRPALKDWNVIVSEASKYAPAKVGLEDLLSPTEISNAFRERDEINAEFSHRTSIVNKTDLCFLAIATELQTAKALLFSFAAEKLGYGKGFDPAERLAHNDKWIEKAHREANDRFRDKYAPKYQKGYWINLLYQTPPYDITKGSAALGINMEGKYHRLHTLGHDPVLGWLFGIANILTDTITLNNFQSFRVTRKPKMAITSDAVGIGTILQESLQIVNVDYLNLPAAIFAQAQHLKSDAYTKTGLPVPVIAALNGNFASYLYKKQYDALCFARDVKISGASYMISLLIDAIIGVVHGLFRQDNEERKLYEVRTRKILLVSNAIASSSTIINACITQNQKNLDIGSLLVTLTHLFADMRFISKIRQEFIENEIYTELKAEMDEIDEIYNNL